MKELADFNKEEIVIAEGIEALVNLCHGKAVEGGWWTDINTGQKKQRNQGEQLMLMVSEISEAMEACRKNLMDDKLPHRKGVEVELADAVIRIGDFCGAYNLDLGGAILEKIQYNSTREDHRPENRKKAGGKQW